MSKIKLNGQGKFKQGVYIPVNGDKLIDSSPPLYRSKLELLFMRFCDNNPNVLKWGSESVVIPYISPIDNRPHRYFVDNFVMIKEGDKIVKYLIEVKPSSQLLKPVHSNRKKKSTMIYEQVQYVVNQAKWNACEAYCAKKGWKFLKITEKELKPSK